jgi:hypothetical protein
MTTPSRYCLGLLLAIALAGRGNADSRYDIIPTPAWVVVAELPSKPLADSGEAAGAADYVLVDHQVRLDKVESDYGRFVTRLTNVSGIEDNSQITIDFDPKVERLHLHSVLIKRGKQSIDQLRIGRVRVIQREHGLEDQLVDGALTFHLVMADVRVGDIVDYSYTLERRNAEWGSRSFGRFQTQWGDPVDFLRIRLLTPVGSPLKTLRHPDEAPKAWVASGFNFVEWSKANVLPFRRENDAPSWFQQYAAIEYSQFANWGAIVEAALPLYRVSAVPSSELKELAQHLAAMGATDADRAIAAMKFVQEEIRYTGIEEGEGAFRPTPPNEVLARRYGDCKDKTLLAVTLLKSLGIDAAPALVSTRWKDEVQNHLPSPGLMNHVVVRAVIGGQIYWFDATSTGQGGRLANFTQASFGKALVISPGVVALESMAQKQASRPLLDSKAIFDLRAGLFAESALSVTTTYLDAEADRMRRRLRTKGATELGKQYLHYYKGQYADARSTGALQVNDNLEENELSVAESYRIKDVFETDKQGRQRFYVNADTISDALKAPDLPERTTPWAMDFPQHLSAKIQILLPTEMDVDADKVNIDTPFFHYVSTVGYLARTISLDYEFKALKDHVPVAQLPAHIKQLERARDDTYFHISRQTGVKAASAPTDSFLALKLVALLAGLFLLLRLARYLLVVRALLSITLQRVQTQPCAENEVPESERDVLESMDHELRKSEFEAAGYVKHSPSDTRCDKPEYIRVLIRRELPTIAYVAREIMPEYGSHPRLWFESKIADGRFVQTIDGSFDPGMAAPDVLAEAISGASATELAKRHEQRLTTLASRHNGAVASPSEDFAERIAGDYAGIRSAWLRKGWSRASADPDLNRVTIKGALHLARSSLKIYGARASGRTLAKAAATASPRDREVRAAADYVAVWHSAREPRSAPRANWALIGYCAMAAVGVLGMLALISGIDIALATLMAVVVHELGHALTLRARRASSGPLFLMPFTGLVRNEQRADLPLTDRVGVMLAGPNAGLLVAIVLLIGDLFWPSRHLRDAAWVFIVFNGLLLIPFSVTDGSRILSAVTSSSAQSRLIAQFVSVVAVLAVGIYLKSAVLNSFGFVWAVVFAQQISTFYLRRDLLSQIPKDSSWETAARAALVAMTGAKFGRWSAPIRQMQAIGIANEIARPTSDQRARAQAIVAYVSSATLAIAAALCAGG